MQTLSREEKKFASAVLDAHSRPEVVRELSRYQKQMTVLFGLAVALLLIDLLCGPTSAALRIITYLLPLVFWCNLVCARSRLRVLRILQHAQGGPLAAEPRCGHGRPPEGGAGPG